MSDSFERLLARTERQRTGPANLCPEPGVLAAYLDATLSPAERTAVEAHAADCARCALQLATVVRLEDESGQPQHAPASRWRPALAWLVPAATAALVAAIYVALPAPAQRPALRDGTTTADDRNKDGRQAGASEQARPAHEEDAWANAGLEAAQGRVPRTSSEPIDAGARQPNVDTRPEDVLTREASPRERNAFAADRAEPRAKAEDARVPAAPPGAAGPESAESAESVEAVEAAGAAGAAGQLSQNQGLARRPRGEPVPTTAPLIVRAPGARVHWRVTPSRIERSTDDGGTWATEQAPPFEQITMAAAPSPEVCWLASPSGQVLRRSEDGTWLDVSPSPRLPIDRLDSTAPLDATVLRPDGTRDSSVDGGLTWRRTMKE
jgi:hypothetical protein